MITQTQNNKMGEIEFRKKLARQQVEGIMSLDDEFSSDEIEMILGDRMRTTFEQMTLHKNRGIVLSPYIEIGAERGQRSLVMENDIGAEGAAIDISYDMLKSCDYYSKKFDKSKTPLRICCDAYNLPFLSNSIPFVFCYETLHHFPHPRPVVNEIFRVLLPGGYFFFAEEPFKGVARLGFFESKHRDYSKQARDRGTVRKMIEFFLCKKRCNEIEHDIIENDAITIGMWKRLLSPFETKDVTLELPNRLFTTNLFEPKSYVKILLACLLGGNIKGLCQKAGMLPDSVSSIYDVIQCPDCAQGGGTNQGYTRSLD